MMKEMNKYELTNETMEIIGKTLYRIKALKDFGRVKRGDLGGFVETEKNLSQNGDAWVYADACVYDNAKVSGNARVSGDVEVYGNAKVTGNARAYDNARIFGNAVLCDDARVSRHAWLFGNAKLNDYVWLSDDAMVTGDAMVYGNARVIGDARVHGDAKIDGDAYIEDDRGYFLASKVGSENGILTVFKNRDGEYKCTRGCFYGTTDELLERSKSEHDKKTHKEYKLLIEVAKSRLSR